MVSNKKEYFKYILPSLISAVLFCIVLIIKGIFPFGSETIDYYDMAQQISAFYFHVYDMLHGTKAFFYDWYTGLGVNMAMSTSGCSNLSLFNLFFLFIPREKLLESLSIFQLIKMMCMSLTMYIYLHKTRKISYFYEVIFSVGYSFCGFVLLLYITNQWMDLAIMFPLIVMFTERLLKDGKSLGYIITLSLALINSYYITFMMLIYIILMTGLFLLADRIFDKSKLEKSSLNDNTSYKRCYLFRLLVCTLESMAISCFILLPQLIQTLASARFESENGGGLFSLYYHIISQLQGAYTTRYFSLLGLSFISAILLYGLIKAKLSKKEYFVIIGAIVLIVAELFAESINLIWHFGSYIQYPIRNGFMIYFTMAVCTSYVIERLYTDQKISVTRISIKEMIKNNKPMLLVTILLTVVGIVALIIGIPIYRLHAGLRVRTVFHMVVIIMFLSFIVYFIIMNWCGKKKYLPVCAVPLIACELIFFGFLLFGKPLFVTGYSEEPEEEGEYIRIVNQLSESFDIEPDCINRIKNPDESLNANYGLAMKRATISNWTHMISPELLEGSKKWGNTYQFTRLLDAGGTAFSDALIGVKNVVSHIEQTEELYEKLNEATAIIDHRTGETATYGYYRNKYTVPYCILMDAPENDPINSSDTVGLHNLVYQAILKDNKNIAEWAYGENGRNKELIKDYLDVLQADEEVVINGNVSDIIKVDGYKALYFMANSVDEEYHDYEITVNGKVIPVPSLKENDNTTYPAHFNNNAVFLGCFRNEEVQLDLDIIFSNEYNNYEYDVLMLDMDILKDFCDSFEGENSDIHVLKNGMDINIKASDNQVMLIPVAYDDGYKVKVNDKDVDAYRYAGIFTAIPVEPGDNVISIRFTPVGMRLGTVISVIAVALFIFIIICNHKGRVIIKDNTEKKTDIVFTNVCLGGYVVILAIMYVIPVIAGIIINVFVS